MTRAQLLLAGRLLNEASSHYANHGCNDMPDSFFEGLTPNDLAEIEVAYNEHNHRRPYSEIPDEDVDSMVWIGDFAWMGFLGDLLIEAAGGVEVVYTTPSPAG